ncbi:DEAD/DEAH box helicase [Clostridium perfringens]|uniref:DEAD/DEAH box helicase n=1 Tax=Clostridium perfringens TaxID=1502 RepID=UPI000E537089|nr:DEAD/DEAH box helicase [Clostridium perfringens]MBI6054118.1 DEAD/DEAH box helicase family protein [Clostridium perfringens]MDK0635854.1 DEAD/DEAH box helicase family protein [Clostridium perfringens]MDK0739141.1 DEAD/DEAH box helicase family protein [Clostridium perfringens]MDK0781672.1 DEAD/DEAH box helicase family protein [Clostridium perfringens]MDK0804955.1 DEAD/DEAH box helicase family protein [Clostridium perfringens]
MVDFTSRLKKRSLTKKVDPVEIYDDLDRKSVTGPLRPVQRKILNEWYDNRKNDRDLIIKLHTGSGKTLIGLLILQSKLNSNEGPCIYVCPNIYLVKQVCEEAEKFGVNYCCIEDDNIIPNKFLSGKSILIIHVQKLFNGKSIFGIDNNFTKVGTIILDDSHACIDSINDSFKINISKKYNSELYSQLLNLFSKDLKEQGEGTFLDIENEEFNQFLPIPYWAWEEKKQTVLELLSKYKDSKEILYVWPLLKDRLSYCRCYINGKKIEISPYKIPIHSFGTFNSAKNRILMSATTQNDAFFIKGLNFDINSVRNPLVYSDQLWSGEKMIISPTMIHHYFTREAIIAEFAKQKQTYGIVSITPTFEIAKEYSNYGAKIAEKETIVEHISKLKSEDPYNLVVFANRYDGIDLPDSSCRVLIVDSLPFSDSLADKYHESCVPNSEIINIKLAQKIEQGIGRSVRGERDFSAILLIGSDLTRFVNSIETRKYFSPQTQKQLEIGLEVAELLQNDKLLNNPAPDLSSIKELISQLLNRDDGWKRFYDQLMNEQDFKNDFNENDIYDILIQESNAELAFENRDIEQAINIIQRLIDSTKNDLEKGWYIQELARYKYFISKMDSNKLQKAAFNNNKQLLKPQNGIFYEKINYIDQNRIANIKKWMGKFCNFTEMMINIDDIVGYLKFGTISDKFESALDDVGIMLGFQCQRPDKLIRKGPDNLWCLNNNDYLLFECKSEVKMDRAEISKTESGQMNNHCAWFSSEYPNAKCTKVLIIPTKKLSYSGDFSEEVFIMRPSGLNKFKDNILSFFREFKSYDLNCITDEKIQSALSFHKLDSNSLKTIYYDSVQHIRK